MPSSLIEYVLVASLISLAAIIVVKSVATVVGNAFISIGTKSGRACRAKLRPG